MTAVQTRHQRCTTGRAHARATVSLHVPGTLARHAVEVRRFDKLLPVTTKVAHRQIIAQNEDNIRLLSRTCSCDNEKDEDKRCSHAWMHLVAGAGSVNHFCLDDWPRNRPLLRSLSRSRRSGLYAGRNQTFLASAGDHAYGQRLLTGAGGEWSVGILNTRPGAAYALDKQTWKNKGNYFSLEDLKTLEESLSDLEIMSCPDVILSAD